MSINYGSWDSTYKNCIEMQYNTTSEKWIRHSRTEIKRMLIKEVYNESHVTQILTNCLYSKLSPFAPIVTYSLSGCSSNAEVRPNLITDKLNYTAEGLLVKLSDLN